MEDKLRKALIVCAVLLLISIICNFIPRGQKTLSEEKQNASKIENVTNPIDQNQEQKEQSTLQETNDGGDNDVKKDKKE